MFKFLLHQYKIILSLNYGIWVLRFMYYKKHFVLILLNVFWSSFIFYSLNICFFFFLFCFVFLFMCYLNFRNRFFFSRIYLKLNSLFNSSIFLSSNYVYIFIFSFFSLNFITWSLFFKMYLMSFLFALVGLISTFFYFFCILFKLYCLFVFSYSHLKFKHSIQFYSSIIYVLFRFFLLFSLFFLVSFLICSYLFYLDAYIISFGYIPCLKCVYLPVGIPFFEWVLHTSPLNSHNSLDLGLSFVTGDTFVSSIIRYLQQMSLNWENYYIQRRCS